MPPSLLGGNSLARHVVTHNARRYLYGEGPVVPRDCAASCLKRIGQAQLEFAIRYLDYDYSKLGKEFTA